MAVTGQDLVDFALQQRGKPYVFGEEGPDEFDCSGLVQYVAEHFGLSTPRITYDMAGSGSPLIPVSRNDLQAGDLIFSHWGDEPANGHVGIYDGRGGLINAPQTGDVVKVTPLTDNYWSHVDGFRRIPGVNGAGNPSLAAAYSGDGGIGGAIGKAAQTIAGYVPNPGTVTQALGNIGAAGLGVAQGAQSVGKLAELAAHAFLPSTMIRIFALGMALIFLIIGVWFLSREIRMSNG